MTPVIDHFFGSRSRSEICLDFFCVQFADGYERLIKWANSITLIWEMNMLMNGTARCLQSVVCPEHWNELTATFAPSVAGLTIENDAA